MIKKIRIQKGLTQKQLALKAGMSQNFLSEVERNKKDITLSMLDKISKALDVCPKDLFDCTDCSRHYE